MNGLFFLIYLFIAYPLLHLVLLWLIDNGLIKWYAVRLSPMFILSGGKRVNQLPSREFKRELKKLRQSGNYSGVQLCRIMNSDITGGISSTHLRKGMRYTTTTHMLHKLKKSERHGDIRIISITPKRKRLLIESMVFFSLREILRFRKQLVKQFYKVKFEYTKENENAQK